MYRQLDSKRLMLVAMTMVVIMMMVVFPTTRMVGCSMQMGPNGSMPTSLHAMHADGLDSLKADCPGYFLDPLSIDGLVPSALEAFALALIAALLGGILVMASRVELGTVPLVFATPPPPPLEPRGERFLI